MLRIYYILCFLICIIYSNFAKAVTLKDMFNPTVQVFSKELSTIERDLIIKQQFELLLKKLTGKTDALPSNDLEQYVSKYEYQNISTDEHKINLKIYFDKNLIQKKLTNTEQLFMGEYRPLTIIWPKTNNPILSEYLQDLLNEIFIISKDYGLTIIYPVLDLKEVALLNQEPKDKDFTHLIKVASKRYNADEIILVDCQQNLDQLHIKWISLVNIWELTDQLLEHNSDSNHEAIRLYAYQFVNKLMEKFINLYAGSKESSKDIILLKISNINNLEDYVKIERFLHNLTIINHLHLSKFKNGEVEFQINSNVGKKALKNHLLNNSTLSENKYTDNNYPNSNLLSYTFN